MTHVVRAVEVGELQEGMHGNGIWCLSGPGFLLKDLVYLSMNHWG